MPLGWIEGQRPFPHHPQGIRNEGTLVQTNLKRSINSRVGNVSPYLSVFQDKFLAELAKEVCVVCAADHSNFRSVKGDSVTRALICYKNSKHCSQAMYSDGEHSTASFGTIPRETYVKLCSKSAAVLTPRVHMKPIVGTAVPRRRSAELSPPCLSNDVPHDRSLRSLSYSFFYFMASFSCFMASPSLRILAKSFSLSPLQLVEPQPPRPIQA